MPVNILNLSGLRVLDFKENEREYHIKAEPVAVARLCPHCGRSHEVIGHGKLPLYVRDLPTHGKQVMIHLDAPRLMTTGCMEAVARTTWTAETTTTSCLAKLAPTYSLAEKARMS